MKIQGIPRTSSVQVPPETITDEVSGIQVENRDREYYDQGYTQGWNDCAIKANETLAEAMGKVKKMLQAVLADVKAEPPNQTIVQAGAELVDEAMKDLLNHGCKEVYSDYLTIRMIEKWLAGKGSHYLAALVEAIRTAQR